MIEELRRNNALLAQNNALLARLIEQKSGPEKKPSRITVDDRLRITALLPELRKAVEDRSFTLAEIEEIYVPRHPSLRSAITAANLNNLQLGKLLARFNGQTINGLTITRYDRKWNDGRPWQIKSDEDEANNVIQRHNVTSFVAK